MHHSCLTLAPRVLRLLILTMTSLGWFRNDQLANEWLQMQLEPSHRPLFQVFPKCIPSFQSFPRGYTLISYV